MNKKISVLASLVIGGSFALNAAIAQVPVITEFKTCDTTAVGLHIYDVTMAREDSRMNVGMKLNLADMKMKGDRAMVFTPMLVNDSDTLRLTPVTLYGRTRWIQYQRNGLKPSGVDTETAYKFSERPSDIAYFESVPYEDWMNGARLELDRSDYGCCRHLIDNSDVELASWSEIRFQPTFSYVRPIGVSDKRYELEGQSFVDFPVDQTVIYPNYRRNAIELDSIKRTIDIARNNPDATIDTIWLKGFASPESPYSHNADLAVGRTKALRDYIQSLYNFDGVAMITDYEPEDWEGLRIAVENSNLAHKDEILAIIDSDMAPDPKEWKIKSTYPADYKVMLAAYYPALRHTNYKVSYTIRTFSDPQEILEIMRTRPANLSLNEFYIAASALEPGSDEFNEVFETAVRMYPNDQAANLNAANAAMQRGEYVRAERYLNKAGESGDAYYARAVQAAMTGNFASARENLEKAEALGCGASPEEINALKKVIDRH